MQGTVRLYEGDPYAVAFDAEVVRSLTVDGRPAVVLDRTCFYPTSGGQPHDTGWLDGIRVLDVVGADDEIVHMLDVPLASDRVHGRVDWSRRRDHMQQHTGQHILSRAFLRICDAPTVSFHLGDQASTIDLDVAELEADAVEKVLVEANDVVFADLPVDVRVYDHRNDLPETLRKAPTVEHGIRVVSVGDYDASACCGTHVRRTGEIGTIQVTRWERAKGQVRVTFVCGGRALADHWHKTGLCHEVTALLSCGTDDVVELVAKALEDRKSAEKRVFALQERLAATEAERLRAQAEPIAGVRLVDHIFDEMAADSLRQMARDLVADAERMVAVLATRSPSPVICVACDERADVRADALLRAAITPLGGRGGGNATLAQGGGVCADELSQVLEGARLWLRGQSDAERGA
ncbi:MAG: alanyl-tRNA editing protein [Anaerolineae bacterium]